MKTRKFLKRLLAGFMSVMMIMSATAVSLFAVDEAEAPKTVWNGDKKTVEVKAGENGYTFLSVYASPYANYETSNHTLKKVDEQGSVGLGAVSLLPMVAANCDYTWKPDGLYEYGKSNYDVMYCCDNITPYNDGVYYKRINLEDSDYYSIEDAKHIRAIVTNSYPYISISEMKKKLVEDGFEYAEEINRADIIAAVQAAIWSFSNAADFKGASIEYNITANISVVIFAILKIFKK